MDSESSSSSSSLQLKDEAFTNHLTQVFGQLKTVASTMNILTSTKLSESQQNELKPGVDSIIAAMNEMRLRHGNFTNKTHSIIGADQMEYEYSDIDDLEFDIEYLTDKFLENVDRYLLEHQQLKGKIDPETKLSKPQMEWRVKPDNSNQVFVPLIREKPNALISLHESMNMKQEIETLIENFPYSRLGFGLGGDVRRDSKPHPYHFELEKLKYRDDQLRPCTPLTYKNMDEVSCHWIDTKDKLLKLASLLDTQTEFAIDLEHHSFRTYQGLTCLMQISTRDEDYLLDTIFLKDDLYVLNTSFTNPKIVKVMHGADCDILWLQRDFGIYIVNLFDTGQAARVLGLSPAYAFILPYYCKINPDKKYQLADWRLRPLPSVMINYARSDTHFLLYIYDRLRNDIFDQRGGSEGLHTVLEKSRYICMRRYEKFILEEHSYFYLRRKFNGITQEEDNIVRELFRWRDLVSREYDESVRYVLPDDTLVYIATKKPLTVSKLLHICSPASKILKDNAELVVGLIQKAIGDQYVPEEVTDTPAKEFNDSMNITKESPILDLSQLCQQAQWFSKPDVVPSFSFTDEELNLDSIQIKSGFQQANVFVPEGIQPPYFAPGNPFHHNTSVEFMDIYSPSPAAKPVSLTFNSNSNINSNSNEEDESFTEENSWTPRTLKYGDSNTPPDAHVPKSMDEIYLLSQQNRKINKEKKKLKQTSISDPRPAYSPDSPRKQSPSKEFDDPNDFMDQIGWKMNNSLIDSSITSHIPIHPVEKEIPSQGKNDSKRNNSSKRGGRKVKR